MVSVVARVWEVVWVTRRVVGVREARTEERVYPLACRIVVERVQDGCLCTHLGTEQTRECRWEKEGERRR